MKHWKILIFLGLALILNSCIIKSLQPFYTIESLSYNETFIGKWTDSKKGQWNIKPAKALFSDSMSVKKTGNFNNSEYSIEVNVKEEVEEANGTKEKDKTIENDAKYKLLSKGYLVTYKEKNKEALFIAMPFKIGTQYFLDFIPFMYEDNTVNGLVNQHLMETHSVAKVDINTENKLSFSWLRESKIEDLFKTKKLRLKHEKIGYEEDLLLTATSEELYEFLKKYQKADIEDKWKSSDRLQLTKTNAKP
jgi:hypothetical protein